MFHVLCVCSAPCLWKHIFCHKLAGGKWAGIKTKRTFESCCLRVFLFRVRETILTNTFTVWCWAQFLSFLTQTNWDDVWRLYTFHHCCIEAFLTFGLCLRAVNTERNALIIWVMFDTSQTAHVGQMHVNLTPKCILFGRFIWKFAVV